MEVVRIPARNVKLKGQMTINARDSRALAVFWTISAVVFVLHWFVKPDRTNFYERFLAVLMTTVAILGWRRFREEVKRSE